jgi:RNA polymerase primary sigma factor
LPATEQIEILRKFSEVGINVVDTKEARLEERRAADKEPEEDATKDEKALAKSRAQELAERTDDPVRMHLREMASMELLIAQGQDRYRQTPRDRLRSHVRRLCESPLTFPGHCHLARSNLMRAAFYCVKSSTSMQPMSNLTLKAR